MRYNRVKMMALLLGAGLSVATLCTACGGTGNTASGGSGVQTVANASEINLSEAGDTLKITKGGSYTLTGTMESGTIVVDAEDEDVELILDGVTINSDAGVAIYVEKAEAVTITLADGSVNTITTEGIYSDEKIDAAIFAKCDLTLDGTGTLNVTAANCDAIYSKKELTVLDGTYNIQTADGAVEVKTGSDDFGGRGGFGGHGTWNQGTDQSGNTADKSKFDKGSFDKGNRSDREGMTRPEGGQMPEGMTPPEGGQMPEGMTPPEGDQMPEGMALPEEGQMPDMQAVESQDTTGAEDTDDTSLKGLKAKKGIVIAGGVLNINTEDDAIHSNGELTIHGGTINIETGDDGIHAESDLVISAGTINVAKCYEGIEGLTITVDGGDITLVSNDDGMNAANPDGSSGMGSDDSCKITINGGNIYIDASGDGIDSNGDLEINGGNVYIMGPADGANAAVDYGDGAKFVITGGELLALGNSNMAENASNGSTQSIFLATLSENATGTITIMDAEGNVLCTYENAKQYNSVLYSSEKLTVGETYTITAGSSTTEVTMEDTVTGQAAGGMGGFMRH